MAPVTARDRLRSERGAKLIELMIVFPIFTLLLAGLVNLWFQ